MHRKCFESETYTHDRFILMDCISGLVQYFFIFFHLFVASNKKTPNFAILNYGPVVQLVRMPPCHGGGRGFESRPVRKIKSIA